jgi:hypothetical protein
MLDLRQLDLPREFLLLLALLRCTSKQELEADIDSFVPQPVDWQAFVALIDRHLVAPFVHSQLSSWGAGVVPDHVQSQIRERYRSNGLHALLLASEFTRLAKLFETNGIPVLPLKGFALAVQVYGDLSMRHSGDLDVLVPPRDADSAAELLRSNGYVNIDSSVRHTAYQRERIKQFRNHFVYRNQEKGIKLELHWRLLEPRYLFNVSLDELLARAQTIVVGDRQLKVLSIEDTLLFALTHGASHAWNHLFWLCDVSRILRQGCGLDWHRIVGRAVQLGISRPLAQGLILSHQLLDTSVPYEVLVVAERDPVIQSLLETAIQAIRRQDPFPTTLTGRIQDVRYQIKLSRSVVHKLDHVGSRLLDIDGWDSLPLPNALFPLYYLLGPLTWMARRLRKD